MKKINFFLTVAMFLLFGAISTNAKTMEVSDAELSARQTTNDPELVGQLLAIREQLHKENKPLFFMQIDVSNSVMTTYKLTDEEDGTFSLEEISTNIVGTPKSKKYPRGFGFITAVEKNPVWAPTPATVKQFKKHGMDLEKFRNDQGKIIIPAGNVLNYMGPLKMRIKFLEKQAYPELNRDVYRIHGTLKKDERKLGTRCSAGCIRTKNNELLELNEEMKGGFIVVEYI